MAKTIINKKVESGVGLDDYRALIEFCVAQNQNNAIAIRNALRIYEQMDKVKKDGEFTFEDADFKNLQDFVNKADFTLRMQNGGVAPTPRKFTEVIVEFTKDLKL